MRLKFSKVSLNVAIVFLLLCSFAIAETINFSKVVRESVEEHSPFVMPDNGVRADYEGRILIYMVEPFSLRWRMSDGTSYTMCFLDFALDTNIAMDYMDTLVTSIPWTVPAQFQDQYYSETNMMAIAVVYNSERHPAYAYPPTGNPFNAYYNDACAAADYLNSWPNVETEEFSHTVFIEQGTATW
jgi:hypothetical protein